LKTSEGCDIKRRVKEETDVLPSKKTFFIESVGCTENIIDGAILKNIAEANGLEYIHDPSRADLIVFNTCAFKQKQEDLCFSRLAHYEKIKKSGAEILVCGCLTEISPEKLRTVFGGTAFAPKNLESFSEFLAPEQPRSVEEAHLISRDLADSQMFGQRALVEKIYDFKAWIYRKWHLRVLPNFNIFDYIGDENTLFVRISRGCLNQCGYCAIRFAQGTLASQPQEAVLEVIRQGIADGFKKVFLVGTNTSQYGRDIGTDFLTLLENVLNLDGDFRVIIHNFEPHGIEENPDKYLRLLASPKVLSFYFPLNSGSQPVLDRMRRGYNIDRVVGILRKLRDKNKKILIRSEFIVGYPGESWRDFRKTLALVAGFSFNQVDLHHYSPRPGIAALALDRQVSAAAKYARFAILHALVFFKTTIRKLRPF
jgi:tRNA-2-methylthio-N6-dimethylallyladenosine synthase